MKKIVSVCLPILAGALAGYTTVVLTAKEPPPAPAPSAKTITETKYVYAPGNQMPGAPAQAAPAAPAAPGPGASGAPAPSGSSAEELAKRERTVHEGFLESHRQEPEDHAWASSMESKLGGGMAELTKRFSATTGAVDCRSVSCTVDLEWPSAKEASSEYMQLLLASGEVNDCIRRLALTEEPSEGSSYKAVMYVDCTDNKLGESTHN